MEEAVMLGRGHFVLVSQSNAARNSQFMTSNVRSLRLHSGDTCHGPPQSQIFGCPPFFKRPNARYRSPLQLCSGVRDDVSSHR